MSLAQRGFQFGMPGCLAVMGAGNSHAVNEIPGNGIFILALQQGAQPISTSRQRLASTVIKDFFFMFRFSVILPLFLVVLPGTAFAGSIYEVTAKLDDKTVTYRVKFGGGKLFKQYTAYDASTKKFVYLTWPRKEKGPKPVGSIWDHDTGRTISLYQFPGIKHPLPVIPSMEAMKFCPKTGDRDFKSNLIIIYD